MDTKSWVGFFRKAGLPQTVAANYALIFSENRIQLGMLLDLSKEYLYDMGIKVMGDVIAILKYSREFANQLAKEREIGAVHAFQPSISAPKKPIAPVAERIVGHYTRQSPAHIPTVPAQTLASARLPVTPIPTRRAAVASQQPPPKIISLKRTSAGEFTLAKKIRRVPPEEEGAYTIKMPQGTTAKTRRIMHSQAKPQAGLKRSVFTRLGSDSSVSSSTDVNKASSSVFNRLGPNSDLITSTMGVSSKKVGSPLEYRGVLKNPTNGPWTTVATARTGGVPSISQINAILANTQLPAKRPIKARIGIPAVSNIKSRLGGQLDARIGDRTGASLSRAAGGDSVFDRLGR